MELGVGSPAPHPRSPLSVCGSTLFNAGSVHPQSPGTLRRIVPSENAKTAARAGKEKKQKKKKQKQKKKLREITGDDGGSKQKHKHKKPKPRKLSFLLKDFSSSPVVDRANVAN
ncbi:unnamed protein product [Pleuronectes platessa]|uniref:Uncharacterized protein n=1 Tax=Pleuronectes platessa TaxID=8262 RepID=A0A9N7UTW7_PLEPL|nr:unnamed protein product [Pleuronectes platessa]